MRQPTSYGPKGPARCVWARSNFHGGSRVVSERAPRVLSRIALNPISRFSSRFSYRIIPVLVRFTSFQNPHVAAPRCFHLSHLRRASDQNSNYAVRKTRRAASLAWPGGGIHSERRLPPGRPWASNGSFLRLLDFPSLSAPVCFAFRFAAALCFGFFLLLLLSFALLFGWQPRAEPMFTERPTWAHCTAHTGAGHGSGSTCPPQNRRPLVSLRQVSWPPLWRQAAHRRHSRHQRGGQTCAGAWPTSSSSPPIPRLGGTRTH